MDKEETGGGTVSRSFSIERSTSELLNRMQKAEKRRPFSHILGEAITDYAEKNHPALARQDD